MSRWIDEALRRYPALEVVRPKLEEMVCRTVEMYRNGGTFFVAGNGGSAADADHICGELLKGFKSLRPLPAEELDKWQQLFGEEAREKAAKLQMGLPAVSLLSHPGFISAFGNDVDGSLAFAQQLLALGKKGDIFLGISTGGGAENIKYAFMAAKTAGIFTILLTGNKHGICEKYADLVIDVPESETFKIQELHLPVYHAFCLEVEDAIFGNR
ncbi:MAG: SIS domain-containing protein [Lentisphaeria bacterium]|nr:SIS domain-containing protein [Lentisphaeria bacterium]MBR7119757.1 SIS domain-containing protein [Lentisphaeria bacterium]